MVLYLSLGIALDVALAVLADRLYRRARGDPAARACETLRQAGEGSRMSKRISGRFGVYPYVPAARGAPLPLVTQPMIASDDPAQTRVDNPLQRVDPALAGAVLSKPAPMATPRPSPAGPPPEIGLTQHALPQEDVLDPRLVLASNPDSERAAAFRVLRHHLLELGRPQDVNVSSLQHGAGKTPVAMNLALALAA